MVLSCYDRLIFTGSLPEISYARGMTGYLNVKGIKIFDYPRFAEPYKEKIRAHIENKSEGSGVPKGVYPEIGDTERGFGIGKVKVERAVCGHRMHSVGDGRV